METKNGNDGIRLAKVDTELRLRIKFEFDHKESDSHDSVAIQASEILDSILGDICADCEIVDAISFDISHAD